MNYINVEGGLGNQMFQFAFCLSLKKKYGNTILFKPYADSNIEYGHQGYELAKVFGIINKTPFYSKLLFLICRLHLFFCKRYISEKKLLSLGLTIKQTPTNLVFYDDSQLVTLRSKCISHSNLLYQGFWQSEKFFEDAKDEVLKQFVFKQNIISSTNKKFVQSISESKNSVSIHIRRGDYLKDDGFSKCTNLDYYMRAIHLIEDKIENPLFIVFSDDMEWAKTNLSFCKCIFIDWNSGADSWQDMYLMSCCSHNIVANSSFSWWGAYLNPNPDKIVIAPKKWWYYLDYDDVVPSSWIRL